MNLIWMMKYIVSMTKKMMTGLTAKDYKLKYQTNKNAQLNCFN